MCEGDVNLSGLNLNEIKTVQDVLKTFVQNLYRYLVATEEFSIGLLVKKHSNNLRTQGDYSFLNIAKAWQDVFREQLQSSDVTLLRYVNKNIADLISESKDWLIPIVKALEVKDRIHLFLDRPTAIRVALQNGTHNEAVVSQIIDTDTTVVKIDPYCEDSDSLTFLRLKCLSEVIKKLYLISSYPQIQSLIILVTWRSGYKYLDDPGGLSLYDIKFVYCGTVLNAKTGLKENSVRACDYIRMRQEELTLIAQHKYGVRASTEEKWKDFIAHLGESTVTFELLQTNCSSPVKIQFDASGGSSKGAAFILYNCARLETLIRTFNEKVEQGTYPPLPSLEDTDLSLLTDEDEWYLVFTYIMGLPALLDASVGLTSPVGRQFRPHLICNFLSGMVKVLSQYYRRVRILTLSFVQGTPQAPAPGHVRSNSHVNNIKQYFKTLPKNIKH